MKICIVTQPLHNNYGGILQNYALQKVLRDMGQEPVTIDYVGRRLTYLRVFISALKTILLRCVGKKRSFLRRNKRNRKNSRFVKEYIALSRSVSSYNVDLVKEIGAEVVIVGSDQVWRVRYNRDTINDMYLKFLENYPIKRIAYAASFGMDNIHEYTQKQISEYRKLLSRFVLVSVREKSGVDICKTYLGVQAEHVLDPTLLLTMEDYLKLCEVVPLSETKYLAAYLLDKSSEKNNLVNEVAKNKRLKVKKFTADTRCGFSVEEWLAMFRDAECVVTDSFHGTVFSIIFNKPFKVLSNAIRGNARIESLLSTFNLEMDSIEGTDWGEVNDIREEQAGRSKKILRKGLGIG